MQPEFVVWHFLNIGNHQNISVISPFLDKNMKNMPAIETCNTRNWETTH